MTEGIIQQAIKELQREKFYLYDNSTYREILSFNESLQVRLIEKIKIEFKDYDIDIQRMLIGDNV